ncbi:MAG: DUF177 domain-containing protein [Mucilaginibacter polytrichastri]|nr:DUF177 domain-containing protein [Mucilaginibacter polytrichastri]
MKSLKPYSIPFTGLKAGNHAFSFDVNDSFFAEFPYSLVKKGALVCRLDLEKKENLLILDLHITGKIALSCDRCLAEFLHPVDVREQQIAKFSDEDMEDADEEIIVLGKNDTEIDISPIIYELVNISVPFVSTCGSEGNTEFCNREMLDKLSRLSGQEEEKGNDPRWDALKNLK